MRRRALLSILLLLSSPIMLLTCAESIGPDYQQRYDQFLELSPHPDESAEAMGLYLQMLEFGFHSERALVVAPYYYERAKGFLDSFKTQHRSINDSINDSVSPWFYGVHLDYPRNFNWIEEITFDAPHRLGQFGVRFTPEAFTQVTNNQFREWDSLNAYFRFKRVRTSNYSTYAQVFFEARFNPMIVCPLYESLMGIERAYPNYHGDVSPNGLYPKVVDGRFRLLMAFGWGDCLAGCMHGAWIYFEEKYLGGPIEYLGRYSTDYEYPYDTIWWWPRAWDCWKTYDSIVYSIVK